jgi:hypothetical protein
MTREQVAEAMGCSRSHVNKLVRQGDLLPHGKWISAKSLDEYVWRLESNCPKAGTKAIQ